MAYRANPGPLSLKWSGNHIDWELSAPGKWFIGVVDTSSGDVFLTPVNPFEDRGQLSQATLGNTDPRAINRYASGVPEDHTGELQSYVAFAFTGNWLEARQPGMTHHSSVAAHYQCDPADCLGFSLIKLSRNGFAQMKCTSTSLNGSKPGHQIHHSFSRATHNNLSGFTPGSAVMPPEWIDALKEFFQGPPFNLTHLAVSFD